MEKIQFTKDFATKKKGDVWECDSQLASRLIRLKKVAKIYKKVVKKHESD